MMVKVRVEVFQVAMSCIETLHSIIT